MNKVSDVRLLQPHLLAARAQAITQRVGFDSHH